jgi:hypothetical protein
LPGDDEKRSKTTMRLTPDTPAGYVVLGIVVVVVGGLVLSALLGGGDESKPEPPTATAPNPVPPAGTGGTGTTTTNGQPHAASTTLSALVDNGAAEEAASLAPADGDPQTGKFQLGDVNVPSVVRFGVFPQDPESTKTVRVPLGGRFQSMAGTFGLDRSHTPCTSGSASLSITDDAGNPIWPAEGASSSVSGSHTVPVDGAVGNVGQLLLVFSSSVPKGDCADSNQEVDVGLALRFEGP